MSSGQRRIFPEAFKREAVARASTSGRPPSKVAAELGLHETVLRRWMRQFNVSSGPAPTAQQRAQPVSASVADLAAENSRLRRENDRLRMEREILKKTVTIFGVAANEVPFCSAELDHMAGARDVRRAGYLSERLLCVVEARRE